jgi:hypothetical protein
MKPYRNQPFLTTEIGILNFLFSTKNGTCPNKLHSILVPLNMSRYPINIKNNDWSKIKSEWYAKKAINFTEDSTSIKFENLQLLLPEIGDMSISEATSWLEAKRNQNINSIEVFGITIKSGIITLFVPVLLLIILLDLIGHINKMKVINGHEIQEVYWSLFSQSLVIRNLGFISLLFLPLLAVIYAQTKLGYSIYSILLTFSIFACSIWLYIATRNLEIYKALKLKQ